MEFCTSQRNKQNTHMLYDCRDIGGFSLIRFTPKNRATPFTQLCFSDKNEYLSIGVYTYSILKTHQIDSNSSVFAARIPGLQILLSSVFIQLRFCGATNIFSFLNVLLPLSQERK